jgi:hypothetical protein
MKNIKAIINEEINKFIIFENINNLSQYAASINNELNRIQNIDGLNSQLKKFVYNFEVYCIQIIHAIKRCVQANSLNEGLGSWGINIPPELGGNFWNDAVRGYYKTKNFLNRGGYGNNKKGNALNGINQNTVPSVKLSELLRQYPSWENNCIKYQISQYVPNINNILQYIKRLQVEYTQLLQQQNAQGTNP